MPAPTARFQIDRRGLDGLLVSSGMQAAMTAAGREVAAQAARKAPKATGALAGSYRVEPTTARVKTRRGTSLRASGRVVNDSPHAAAVEFGHADAAGRPVPGAHTLGRLAGARSARSAARARRRAR